MRVAPAAVRAAYSAAGVRLLVEAGAETLEQIDTLYEPLRVELDGDPNGPPAGPRGILALS